MTKNAKKRDRNQEPSARGQQPLMLSEVIRQNLYTFIMEEGFKALGELLERDREELCGPAYRRGADDAPRRWGHVDGRLTMGGQRVLVRKPRVRQAGREIALPSWAEFAETDPMDERTLEQMVLGVSTRGYKRSIEPVPESVQPHALSKSAASRRFVSITQQRLDAWLQRDLGEYSFVAIMLDGIVVDEHSVIVALGVTEDGTKQPLGLWSGATENSVVCGELLDDLIERNLDAQGTYLFVIDGSKALRKAIRVRFDKRGIVQRCQQHKRRNVLEHLPKDLHRSTSKAISDAYRSKSKSTAKKRLLQLARQLHAEHPDATASIKEGLDEVLTLKDMGLPVALERFLSTTNPIENLNSTIRRVLRRVKRWRGGSIIKRWVAAGVLEAQRGFRKVAGYKGLAALKKSLVAHAAAETRIDAEELVA